MQRLRVMWWMPLSFYVIMMLWSTGLSSRKFISLHQPIVIKAQKNSPPHIAFEALLASEASSKEWARIEKSPTQTLTTHNSQLNDRAPALQKHVVRLDEMVIKKSVQRLEIPKTTASIAEPEVQRLPVQIQTALDVVGENTSEDRSWIEHLSAAQQKRVLEAQHKSEILDQNWSDNSWSEAVQKIAAAMDAENRTNPVGTKASSAAPLRTSARGPSKAEILGSGQRPNPAPPQSKESLISSWSQKPSVIASLDPGSNQAESFFGRSTSDDSQEFLTEKNLEVSGPIEISGGLAITNDHHIEVRRNNEGVVKELGRVDLQKGIYSIKIEDASGVLVAQLVNQEGRVLGEGQIRLNQITRNGRSFKGPKIKLTPQIAITATVASAYGETHGIPANTIATFLKGAGDEKVGVDRLAGLENIANGSATIMRVAGKDHLQTTQIVFSGEESKTQIFSQSMVQALRDIVAEQRRISLSSNSSLIWGQVQLDGKPLAGVTVEVESDPDAEAVYLNELLLPDTSLKATSTNGLYVFVNVQEGFHSMLALQGEKIFGYQNVLVEEGSVALGSMESSSQSETVPLRLYDAFTGEPIAGKIILQSASDEIALDSGYASVHLPRVSRLGLMRAQPEGSEFVPARYTYNDRDSFIHAPLIRWSWLSTIKASLRIDDPAKAEGIIVGFVPEEGFEVYLAGYENINPRQIVYFDVQGQVLSNSKGVAGGGFIIYDVPVDTHEVVIIGERSRKIYTRVLPVDANSVSILNIR